MPQPGTSWHTIRHANGAWQPAFVELEPLEASDPGRFTGIGAGAVTDELELAAISQFIQIWQTARHHDGTWQPDYVLVGSDVQRGFPSVDCAGVASELHVVTVGAVNDGGRIRNTVHPANGGVTVTPEASARGLMRESATNCRSSGSAAPAS